MSLCQRGGSRQLYNLIFLFYSEIKTARRLFTTSSQLIALEQEFAENQYISRKRRAELAVEVNMEYVRVRVWFRNRRVKERRINPVASNQTVKSSEPIPPVILTEPRQPMISLAPKQPVISPAPNPSIFGTLPHLMNGLPTAVSQNFNNWNHYWGSNTNSKFNELLPPLLHSSVGPMSGHNDFYGENYPVYNMPSSNISSNNNYHDFDYFSKTFDN